MKRMMIILMVVIGFCFGLLAQPKAFDKDFYRDTLKVKKSDEFKKLENYRKKYKSLGYPMTTPGDESNAYLTVIADMFFHKGINLDRIEEYKKIGLFNDNNLLWNIYSELRSNVLRPIIVIGKLTSFKKGWHDDVATFEVVKILNGREFYDTFPKDIKCYSIEQGCLSLSSESAIMSYSQLQGGITMPEKNENGEVVLEDYFGRYNPVPGDEFVLYLEIFRKDNVEILHKNKDEFGKINVFYTTEADYLDYNTQDIKEKDKNKAQAILDDLNKKLKVIKELNTKGQYNEK